MPTRVTTKTFSKRVKTSADNLKPVIRANKKCGRSFYEIQSNEINEIFTKQKELSNKNRILDIDQNSGAIETSYSILNSLGISVENEINDINYSIIGNAGIDGTKLETMTKTQDLNPNRIQVKKFQNLKNKKIKSSELFNDAIANPIFELDLCADDVAASKIPKLTNVIKPTTEILDTLRTLGNDDTGRIGGFRNTDLIEEPNLRRDYNVQTTGAGNGRGGVDNASDSGVINRGGSY